ncbi:MAG: response regulator [Peptococcaceae bacterium]|jgi:signal transduction histidine kinase|nr:response regulator [Peptococcaceae bacterium]
MLKNLSLRIKIFALVSTVVIVSFVTLTVIVSGKTIEMAKKDAFNLAQETADKYKNEIIAELQGARITAETLSTVFETLKDHDYTDRDMMNDILKNALAQKEYITAFCIAYDPDALDGKDALYAGAEPAYDETGRFAPYWNKLGGNIAVEPLYDIDIADWYIVPKSERHEYITEPYPYEVQGNPVMLTSLIFPIIHNDGFIGIISSDIVLDKLQEMVSIVTPHEQGGYTEIISNAGVIVARPDTSHLNKSLAESAAYEMLISDRSKTAGALAYAEAYAAEAGQDEDGVRLFTGALEEYAKDFDGTRLDLSLMTPELAQAMLRSDPDRLRYAEEAQAAVKNGEMYISSGKDFYTVYMPVQFSSVTNPWSVAVSIPMTRILDNANDIRNYVILVSAAAVCLIAMILYLITRSVTKPILILSDTAKIFGEGHFDAEVPIVQSNDEIGELSKAFRFMAQKINDLIKEMQRYAKTLEEKNVYLNRLNELKDEFLANTSHELRTPINGIIGIVESMIDGAAGEMSDEQKYNLAIVSNSGKRLSNMVNDILDFTKLKNQEIVLQIKPVDLKPVVDTVIVLSKPLIKGKDLTLVNEIDSSLTLVGADENRVQQILYNLIGNAIKFTEKGKVSVSAAVAGGMVRVSVEDTGIGVAEDKFERIFESFEQADGSTAREYGGTGLGLSITKKIVELHGGTVGVESQLGKGSKFTFTLPVSDVKRESLGSPEIPKTIIDMEDFMTGAAAAEHKPDAAAGEGTYKILVVDDEPVNIQVLTNLLSMRDYSVFKAYNGLEALDLIESGETFDLVLLDVMMPRMSGYEVCQRLREKYTLFDLPIVMLTAKNQIQDIVLGFHSGANDYIQKPFDKEELLARVRTLLELKGAMAAAMAANRAKSLFLANMSHEIRTPLTAVIGLTNLLLNTPMDEKQRDYTEKMRRASSVLLGIINDILDFSKAEAGNLKLERVSLDIRRMFGDLETFFQGQNAKSGVQLRFELDPALPEALLGDPLRLQQVFINLVENAFKFTEQGSITVRASLSRRGPGDVTLDFAVEDTGIGMSHEKMEEIFAAFNQGDNSASRKYGGIGIGLTITRQMVELMGGEIGVFSEEGQGTVFTFSCPFALPDRASESKVSESKVSGAGAAPSPGTDSPEAASPGTDSPAEDAEHDENDMLRGMRVLLVEDNEINALIAMELLNSVGVEVTTAENGSEAIERLKEALDAGGSPAFDLVLMDLQMPVMDGYEATEIIKNTPAYKDLPIYALTAHAFPEERERCLSLGMEEHLTKPIDVEEFYTALRKAAAKRPAA